MKTDNTLGWISLHRKIQSHWLYPKTQERKFTEYEAWVDLLLSVTHKEIKHYVNSQLINVEVGCIITTIIGLSARWKWSRGKVKRFLQILEHEKMITLQKSGHKKVKYLTQLKITNYERLQDKLATEITGNQAQNDTFDATHNQSHNNKYNKLNKSNKTDSKISNTQNPYLMALERGRA